VLSRRELLRLLVPAGIMIGVGGLLQWMRARRKFLRPPGAPSESELISLCLKCRRCEAVCPQGVIEAVTVLEDAVGVGTPTLNFSKGACDFCMKCVEVCPTGALQSVDIDTVRLGFAEVIPQACVAWDWAGCTVCFNVCPYEAISLDEHHRPVVDPQKCNGCGLCEHECLGSALRSYTATSGRGIIVMPVDRL
jgi:ferredoxin-type protein NapG